MAGGARRSSGGCTRATLDASTLLAALFGFLERGDERLRATSANAVDIDAVIGPTERRDNSPDNAITDTSALWRTC